MLLFLFLIGAATTPGSGVDIPPATDPTGRMIAVGVAILAFLGPITAAKLSAKKGVHNGPTPLDSATPRLDVGQQYLERYVQNLEDRVKSTEGENRDLKKQVIELIEDRATLKAQNEALRVDLTELRDEVHELRGQLRGRGNV